ncbi:MAG TPA: NAD(P)/FAD-dependent oxidoreductase [Alphaproteobacteria bacterium]|nr:NAD(P)/FAD-dependent oxidoreductase [Alphaproteobacteria bacterium]
MNDTPAFDAIVIGAGAAGMMCALTAGQRGRRVLLLESGEQAGAKILISGGGRCNFTNRDTAPDRFLSANPHFCKSALARYSQHDFIALVEKHAIAYHEKTLGQLFCDGSARQIVAMLLAECAAGGVNVRLQHRVTNVEKAARFRVTTDKGAFEADAVVLASGGLSIPKMGANDVAHRMAKRFGLAVTETRPALVPLTVGADDLALMQPLSGLAFETTAACGKRAFREAALFTHRGLSGPAILQISSYWREGQEIALDLLPGRDAVAELKERRKSRPKAELKTILGEWLPARLAQALVERRLPNPTMGDASDDLIGHIADKLQRWRVLPAGSEGYAKAEVTLGGIDTNELSSKTMEAKKVSGLYAIGEAVDVTGWLGGYNFQWAWSSGWSAGQAI